MPVAARAWCLNSIISTSTVAENIIIYGRYFGLSRGECEQAAARLLTFAGLSDKTDAKIDSLSGGMKRRPTIAQGMQDVKILSAIYESIRTGRAVRI